MANDDTGHGEELAFSDVDKDDEVEVDAQDQECERISTNSDEVFQIAQSMLRQAPTRQQWHATDVRLRYIKDIHIRNLERFTEVDKEYETSYVEPRLVHLVRQCLIDNQYIEVPDDLLNNHDEWTGFLATHDGIRLALRRADNWLALRLQPLRIYQNAWGRFYDIVERNVPLDSDEMEECLTKIEYAKKRLDYVYHHFWANYVLCTCLNNSQPQWLEWDVFAWQNQEGDVSSKQGSEAQVGGGAEEDNDDHVPCDIDGTNPSTSGIDDKQKSTEHIQVPAATQKKNDKEESTDTRAEVDKAAVNATNTHIEESRRRGPGVFRKAKLENTTSDLSALSVLLRTKAEFEAEPESPHKDDKQRRQNEEEAQAKMENDKIDGNKDKMSSYVENVADAEYRKLMELPQEEVVKMVLKGRYHLPGEPPRPEPTPHEPTDPVEEAEGNVYAAVADAVHDECQAEVESHGRSSESSKKK